MRFISVDAANRMLTPSPFRLRLAEDENLQVDAQVDVSWFFLDLPPECTKRARAIGESIRLMRNGPIIVVRRSLRWDARFQTETSFSFVCQGLVNVILGANRQTDKKAILFSTAEAESVAGLALVYSLFAMVPRDDIFVLPVSDPAYYLVINHHNEIICTHSKSVVPPQTAICGKKNET